MSVYRGRRRVLSRPLYLSVLDIQISGVNCGAEILEPVPLSPLKSVGARHASHVNPNQTKFDLK
jgi:hypothetical protein